MKTERERAEETRKLPTWGVLGAGLQREGYRFTVWKQLRDVNNHTAKRNRELACTSFHSH